MSHLFKIIFLFIYTTDRYHCCPRCKVLGKDENAVSNAIIKQHKDCLKCLLKKFKPFVEDLQRDVFISIVNDDIDCFQILRTYIAEETKTWKLRDFDRQKKYFTSMLSQENWNSKLIRHLLTNSEPDIYMYLVGDIIDALHRKSNTNVLESLIRHGMEVTDCKTAFYRNLSILFIKACQQKCKIKVIQFLYEKGFDINVTDKKGNTGFLRAASMGNMDVLKMLIKYPKCNIDIPNKQGHTPIMVATRYNWVEVIKLIITRREEICNESLQGALHFAIRQYRTTITKILLSVGTPVYNKLNVGLNQFLCANYSLFLFVVAGGEISIFPCNNETSLSNSCRKCIRKILIENSPQSNLFLLVPQLPLPKIIQNYLLHNTRLIV